MIRNTQDLEHKLQHVKATTKSKFSSGGSFSSCIINVCAIFAKASDFNTNKQALKAVEVNILIDSEGSIV